MFQVDIMSRKPVYEQLVDQVEKFILMDVLKPEEQIPSVRSLSTQLSINPNTIQKAYAELDRRGVIQSVSGRGCFVAGDARTKIGERRLQCLDDLTDEIRGMALAGIEKETILQCVEDAYQKGGTSHDSGERSDEDL